MNKKTAGNLGEGVLQGQNIFNLSAFACDEQGRQMPAADG